ncbi:MAG: fumarylacetoacetate hydrolase family protein [Actinomycetaceae bacterium]|nr:fumarylacetoacetate hydrolase family protein [Actinomycetaceae bacterium]
MKLATIRRGGSTCAVRVDGGKYTVIPGYDSVSDLLAHGSLDDAANATGEEGDFASADLAPVLPSPSKVICVGINYRSHIEEMGHQTPEYPALFVKFAESLIGANDDLEIPPETDRFDYEGELTVVIGKKIRRATAAEAEAAIAGYTVANDGSLRDWQYRSSQWIQGKVWEGTTPIGPVIVTPDEFPADARIVTTLDGEVMQDAPVNDLLFGPVALVQYISTMVTLNPGDIILTGTPGGVGQARQPSVYVTPGKTVTVAIDGIGMLNNKAVAEQVAQ